MSDDYENMSRLQEEDSQDNMTIDTASFIDGDDGYGPGSRKRKRPSPQDLVDQQHTMYADALLDYFILSSSEGANIQGNRAPYPPDSFQVDRPIDDQGHTALHWASAMGDMEVVRHFLNRRASMAVRNSRGETPLIRAVLFTNNFEKESMLRLLNLFINTVRDQDDYGANVLHHAVMTTNSAAKRKCARYYLEVILNKLGEVCSPNEFARISNAQDGQGDTPLHIAARHGARKCVRALQGRGVRGDIVNNRGETANQILQNLRTVSQDFLSSSPVLAPADWNGKEVIKPAKAASTTHYHTESARSFSQSFETIAQQKSLQISLALDRELRDKADDLAESQKLLEKLEAERGSVRQATFQHMTQVNDQNDEEIKALEFKEARLKAEALGLSEQLQQRELHALVRSEEEPIRASEKSGSSDDLGQRLQAGLELAAEQRKRRKLTNGLVEAQASAGMSETGETLKKLVSSLTGIEPEQVDDLMPELMDELVQTKVDGPISALTAA